MRKPVRSIAALCAVFFASIGLAACGGLPGDAIVQVNGKPITKATFDHWMTIASSNASPTGEATETVVPEPPSYTKCIAHLEKIEPKPAKGQKKKTKSELKTECAEQYKALKVQVLGYLISSEWILGQAEEMKVSVSEKEVQKSLIEEKNQAFHSKSEFTKYLANSHETVSDLLLRFKLKAIGPKVEEKVTKKAKKAPSKAEISKYYDEHKSTYGTPERRDLNIILTKTEAEAKSAKGEIEGGKSFAAVAKAVSIESVSKSKGGVLDEVEKGQQEKALSEAVFSAKENVLSGPVKTPFGYYIFEVTKTLKAEQKPLSAVEAEIKQTISAKREQTAIQKFGKAYKKKWQARTECRSGYSVEYCKGYKKPKPKTETSTSGSVTATATGSEASGSEASGSEATSSTSTSSTKSK